MLYPPSPAKSLNSYTINKKNDEGRNTSSNHSADKGSNKLRSLGDRLGDLTADGFKAYGSFVARHPGKILIASVVFVVLCIPGITFIRINLDLYKLFVPSDAPVRFEFEGQK